MKIPKDYQKKLFPCGYHLFISADDAKDVIQDMVLNYIKSNQLILRTARLT